VNLQKLSKDIACYLFADFPISKTNQSYRCSIEPPTYSAYIILADIGILCATFTRFVLMLLYCSNHRMREFPKTTACDYAQFFYITLVLSGLRRTKHSNVATAQ